VNYFNFVLVAGTAGMSLATVIRSEFSYPGVGILAGDSLQYLSIATAHGVIMVFYMIMPLIFGAFGNFLLPTQLGVHDVAFPRLNSAAFWFLPGGLIMLMQLVCVDRRYQRMNCFNIRELQGILKRRFFADLVNSADHRDILSSSMIGLRFKNNNTLNLDQDTLSFFKLGTNNSNKLRTINYENSYLDFLSVNSYLNGVKMLPVSLSSLNSLFVYSALVFFTNISNIFYFAPVISTLSLIKTTLPTSVLSILKLNLGFTFNIDSALSTRGGMSTTTDFSDKSINYHSSNVYNDIESKYSFLEQESLVRFSRFTNPIISYDYKCGNYIGIWDKLYPSLMTSFIEVARGIRKAPWYASDQYVDLLSLNYKNFYSKFTSKINLKLQDVDN